MRLRTLAACLLALTSAALFTSCARNTEPPRLVVLLVVDQMRADYIDRFEQDWTGGLKRLVTKGARFPRAAYPYLSTVTCVGHATIGTGALPFVHGIAQNTWYDRNEQQVVPCTADPQANPIGYAGRTGSGNDSAAALKIPTLGDEMRREQHSRVVSLSLKARSAIMLAGHSGNAVSWLSESGEAWQTSSAYTQAPVPQVDAYVTAHPVETDYAKVWERLLPIERYLHLDAGLGEAPPAGWGSTFPHPLRGGDTGRPDPAFYQQWEESPFADAYLGQMAAGLVESMSLGKGNVPDLLAVSFSTPDLVGHAFGPNSQEVQDVYARLDRTIGALLDRLDALVGADHYVVALSADHGVTEIPEQLESRGAEGGRFDAARLALTVNTIAADMTGNGAFVARVNYNDIYFHPQKYAELLRNPRMLDAVLKSIAEQPGVAQVFRAEELQDARTDTDPLKRAAALSYVPGRSGDLVIALKPGWMSAATGTTHGSANPDDQHVPVLFYGAGIKAGTYNDAATPADIAPTLASLIGVTLPSATGHVLGSAVGAAPDATAPQR
ncbi:MAG: alkaline phosphatase family protein [Acidobacteriaceae bacterium]|jgi:predicted AlkP superfamily pyrophosphatase or phosphodiesterase|nr:alkaline phosphatase family protein [Acidobacteriaceae bacterium]